VTAEVPNVAIAEHSRSAMVGALKLSHLLRPKGVPLAWISTAAMRTTTGSRSANVASKT
jgi:hypothetical protein